MRSPHPGWGPDNKACPKRLILLILLALRPGRRREELGRLGMATPLRILGLARGLSANRGLGGRRALLEPEGGDRSGSRESPDGKDLL